MFKPNDFSFASDLDPLILLNTWAHHLDQSADSKNYPEMIFCGLGKPSYLLNEDVVRASMHYWSSFLEKIKRCKDSLSSELSPEELTDQISRFSTAIDYDLSGDFEEAKSMIAQGLSQWYGPKVSVQAKDVIFTVGGIAGLSMLFRILNAANSKGKIVTTSPFYPFYNLERHGHCLHAINLLDQTPYRLTAELLERTILELQRRQTEINAFLFCDPNNPLGFVIGEEEWERIANLLRKAPEDIPVILDEAYCEMTFTSKHVSLLSVAPDLKKRIIILRSGTKGFSSSGERLAMLICFEEKMREKLLKETFFTYLHAPKSQQLAYAYGISAFTEEKRKDLAEHYCVQVEYVQRRLRKMGAALPEFSYKVEGAFYVLADLSQLFGQVIPSSAKKALGLGERISTDKDIGYSLLFQDRLMIAPLSFFGANPHLGYFRITCSGGVSLLSKLLDRLEYRLTHRLIS
jgi:aspartate/methionine/tyrosine aminotransferase